jgi:hypothetical protein
MIGNKIGHRLDPYLNFVLQSREGGTPNLFTIKLSCNPGRILSHSHRVLVSVRLAILFPAFF